MDFAEVYSLPFNKITSTFPLKYINNNYNMERLQRITFLYLAPTSGKLLRGPGPIRGIEGLCPYESNPTSEVYTCDCKNILLYPHFSCRVYLSPLTIIFILNSEGTMKLRAINVMNASIGIH